MTNGKITLQDIYTINQQIYERFDKIEERIERVESRTGCLEMWKSEIIGRTAMFVFILNLIIVFIVEWIKDRFFQ